MMLITNNRKVAEVYRDRIDLQFFPDKSYQDILTYVRDRVHEGHRLLSHPLSGSVKPNETPFKSILITKEKTSLDVDSLFIIEDSLSVVGKFSKNMATPQWTDSILEDFRVIDLSLIEGAMADKI